MGSPWEMGDASKGQAQSSEVTFKAAAQKGAQGAARLAKSEPGVEQGQSHREGMTVGGVLASFSFYYQDLPTVSQNSHSFKEGVWRSVFQRYHQGVRRPL